MVDEHDKDNPVVDQPDSVFPLLLLGAFRSMVDDAHALLAERGHPAARPAHGFALQAVGAGATATEVGRRLGVSKQAAAKAVAGLEREGYVARRPHPTDARQRLVVPTERGRDLLTASARAFEEVVSAWRDRVGAEAVDGMRQTLAVLDVDRAARLDLGAWSSP